MTGSRDSGDSPSWHCRRSLPTSERIAGAADLRRRPSARTGRPDPAAAGQQRLEGLRRRRAVSEFRSFYIAICDLCVRSAVAPPLSRERDERQVERGPDIGDRHGGRSNRPTTETATVDHRLQRAGYRQSRTCVRSAVAEFRMRTSSVHPSLPVARRLLTREDASERVSSEKRNYKLGEQTFVTELDEVLNGEHPTFDGRSDLTDTEQILCEGVRSTLHCRRAHETRPSGSNWRVVTLGGGHGCRLPVDGPPRRTVPGVPTGGSPRASCRRR